MTGDDVNGGAATNYFFALKVFEFFRKLVVVFFSIRWTCTN